MSNINFEEVRRILDEEEEFEAVEVLSAFPTRQCVARWKNAEGQIVVLKMEWAPESPLATPEDIARFFALHRKDAALVTRRMRWVPPEATIRLGALS